MTPEPRPGPVGDLPGAGAVPGAFVVNSKRAGDEIVVTVAGEIDIATAPELWERLEEEILTGPQRIVLDLADAGFIDSTGLTVLIRAHKRLGAAGANLVLRSPTAPVARVLAVSGLDQVIDMETDPEG